MVAEKVEKKRLKVRPKDPPAKRSLRFEVNPLQSTQKRSALDLKMAQGAINTQRSTSYCVGIKRLGSQRAICGKKNNKAAATTKLIKNG